MTFSSTGDRATRLLVIAFAILLVNSSYLAAYASPTLFYFGNIALHILFGGALALGFAAFVVAIVLNQPAPDIIYKAF